MPALQAATGVGPVATTLQVITGFTPGKLGVQLPATVVSLAVHVVPTQLLSALGAALVQAEPGVSCVGPVLAVVQLVTLKLPSVPGVQTPVGVGGVVTVLHAVVIKLTVSVPAEQVPAATKVGPVEISAQVTEVKPFASVGATGTQLLAGAPTILVVGTQAVWNHAFAELPACGLQDPGATASTPLLLLEQVVTTWVVGSTPEVQLATGAGIVGPVVVQVVAVHPLPALGATSTQLFSATGVGPVVDGAGQEMVTQLLPALPVCGAQVPGCTPIVSEFGVQVVVTSPITPGVQVLTLTSGSGTFSQVVITQPVSTPPPGVQAAATGPVTTARHDTNVGPVVLGVQADTGSSVSR